MARRIKAKLIMKLLAAGLSHNAIAKSQKVSKRSVGEVAHAARDVGLDWETASGMTDAEVYAALFPGRGEAEPAYDVPDWAEVHRELAKSGVTLKLLHGEYAAACAAGGRVAMGYDRFCKLYGAWVTRNSVTSRVDRKAGQVTEVDWAGKTVPLVDPATGECGEAYLFVACLPFSRYAYVEACPDMREGTWLRCHVHAFSYFGGSTPIIVPDNLKTGVTSHGREEVVLNDGYRDMAAHYCAAVLPARVRHPKDKASAENTVYNAATAIVARLRGRTFAGVGELNGAIATARRVQRRALPEAGGVQEGRLRGGGETPAAPPAGGALRGLRVGARPEGPAQLPRRLQAQLLLGAVRAGRPHGGPQGHRVGPRGLGRRRAGGLARPVPRIRPQPLLDQAGGRAPGVRLGRVGPRARGAVGVPGGALVLRKRSI